MRHDCDRFDDDAGFGLVEVVVTMFILSLIAMAFLPFLLQSYTNARDNSVRSTGNQLVSAEMEQLRGAAPSDPDCTWLTGWVTAAAHDVATEADGTVHVAGTVTGCPAAAPGSVDVTFTAQDRNGDTVARATTKVFVTG